MGEESLSALRASREISCNNICGDCFGIHMTPCRFEVEELGFVQGIGEACSRVFLCYQRGVHQASQETACSLCKFSGSCKVSGYAATAKPTSDETVTLYLPRDIVQLVSGG